MADTAPSPSTGHPDRLRPKVHQSSTTTRTRWLRRAVRGGLSRGHGRRATAAQRRYRRFLGLALTSGALLVTGTIWASPAQADAPSYLNDMRKVGIHDIGGGAALLQVGKKLCDETWYGYSPDELADMALQRSDTIRGAHGLTPGQANELVYYAKADLCPNY